MLAVLLISVLVAFKSGEALLTIILPLLLLILWKLDSKYAE